MKAAFAAGIERRHLILPLVEISPVISDICSTSHTPTRSCASSTRSQSEKVILSEMTASLESLDVVSLYHLRSCGSYSPSTFRMSSSPMYLPRKAADVSRFALGRMISLSTFLNAAGTGYAGSCGWPKRPCFGLHRQKEMRTSMPRNSYSTSSASFLAASPLLVPLTVPSFSRSFGSSLPLPSALRRPCMCCLATLAVLVAFALMNWLHMTSNLYSLVSRPTSTTKSWNSSMDISSASSADVSEMERVYARNTFCSSPKSGWRMWCTSASHVGHM
mmetsp:Transcript_40996/g.108558  ORF Transcript_40996/g.108558 Transcript_40996/m.108558 type:complete len:275 (+) Transcript_40996:491-1315(+)